MKKFLALSLALILVLGMLAGCSSSDSAAEATPAPDTSSTTTTPDADVEEETPAIDFPTAPIQVIIPYTPGGGSDILTRAIMQTIELPNGQPLVCVNYDGAAGFIGAMEAYNSANDGYTILAHNPTDVLSFSMSGQSDVELWDELEYVCGMVADFDFIAANTACGLTTVQEIIDYATANPGDLKVGIAGSLTIGMANAISLFTEMGIIDYVTLVPYDGGATQKTALLGDHVQLALISNADVTSLCDSGDAIRVVVLGEERAPVAEDVPCTAELGYETTTGKPRSYYAPPGTPQEVIDIIADAMQVVCESEQFAADIDGLGFIPYFQDGATLKASVESWHDSLAPIFEAMVASEA